MNTTVAPSHLLQVFEHQVIQLGDEINGCLFTQKHFHALTRFHGKHGGKYYTLLHRGVKFSHYVGAIQIGPLTIEILPKADKKINADATQWHDILMDMLKECRLLKVETLVSARLKLKSNSILELYYEIFLEEIEKLLRNGLFRKYRKTNGNVRFLKGKLIFHKNVVYNFAHEERFFTEHEQYDYDHLLNRILRKSLEIIETLIFSPGLQARVRRLKEYFPKVQQEHFTEHSFRKLRSDRKTSSCHSVLEIARLLILNYSPDLRGGKHHLVAILFDMNRLFEEYVFRQLKKLENENLTVRRQIQKPFFQQRKIQPDIVLTYFKEKYVLDTKWKILKKASPSMPDLKQIYVYNKYFNSVRCLLIYPEVFNIKDLPPTPFHLTNELFLEGKTNNQTIFCQVCFLKIKICGKLNRAIGEQILEKILNP